MRVERYDPGDLLDYNVMSISSGELSARVSLIAQKLH
jgi:hypothetical protein